MANDQTPKRASIMGLPAELRTEIFEYAGTWTPYLLLDTIHSTDIRYFRETRELLPLNNMLCGGRQWYRELASTVYGLNLFTFTASEVTMSEEEHRLIPHPSRRQAIFYGKHRKTYDPDDWPILDGRSPTDAFYIELPPQSIAVFMTKIELKLLAPGGAELGLSEQAEEHDWRDVEYDDPKDDWLWPLRNLFALGFCNVKELTISVLRKAYNTEKNNGILSDLSYGTTDRGFKAFVTSEVNGMEDLKKMVVKFEFRPDTASYINGADLSLTP